VILSRNDALLKILALGCIGYAFRALLRRNNLASVENRSGLSSKHEDRGILPWSQRVNTMFLTQLVGVYRQWRRYNQSLRELNRLGDRELADIGITRGDIPRVAWDSSER
jgi:uncharacterized protein YjiS (DUF1127 family)